MYEALAQGSPLPALSWVQAWLFAGDPFLTLSLSLGQEETLLPPNT